MRCSSRTQEEKDAKPTKVAIFLKSQKFFFDKTIFFKKKNLFLMELSITKMGFSKTRLDYRQEKDQDKKYENGGLDRARLEGGSYIRSL